MPAVFITPDDRARFKACRREWHWGGSARRRLSPLVPEGEPDVGRALRDALAVYYFPGMWSWDRAIVAPLVDRALERALEDQRAALGAGAPGDLEWARAKAAGLETVAAYSAWAAEFDAFVPVRIECDADVHLADPVREGADLATADGREVRYRHRVQLVALDRVDNQWIMEHRFVHDEWTDQELLRLDERLRAATWAWERETLTEVTGIVYNEVRIGTGEVRRVNFVLSRAEVVDAGFRLGLEAIDMVDPDLSLYPTPTEGHCRPCAFREPCAAMNEGEDAEALLMGAYRVRPTDEDWQEGRLGGASWGMNRGARPNRFGG